MITLHGLFPGLILACLAAGCTAPEGGGPPPSDPAPATKPAENQPLPALYVPSPEESAGVFIGVQKFQYGPNNPPYTVNDAVDLAHALAVEHGLLPLDQVKILLSGDPEGASSLRYEKIQGDARFGTATKGEIESALQEQAATVKPKGVLYVFIASHGYSDGRKNYLMAQDTDPEKPDTAISVDRILEITRVSRGQVVLILDTCRVIPSSSSPSVRTGQEELSSGSRAWGPVWLDKDTLRNHSGYAIFFATGLDRGAEPDKERLNGVFTGTILDGLKCKQAGDQPRINLLSLAAFVQKEAKKRSRGGAQAPELLTGAGFRDFIMVRCCMMEILEPKDGELVASEGVVRLHVCEPGLYAKVVILAESPVVYFHQHPKMDFFLASPDSELSLPVNYGSPDRFQVYVGLGADPEFLGRENQIPRLSETDPKGRPIRWLGPVHVTLPKAE